MPDPDLDLPQFQIDHSNISSEFPPTLWVMKVERAVSGGYANQTGTASQQSAFQLS